MRKLPSIVRQTRPPSASLVVLFTLLGHCIWHVEYGRVEVVKYLLTLPPVMLIVNEGRFWWSWYSSSPLEYACRYEHLSVIEVLVSKPYVHMPNHLRSNEFPVLSLLSRRMSGSTEFPIKPYFPVFMAGNTAAGKSTLTKAMLQLDSVGLLQTWSERW